MTEASEEKNYTHWQELAQQLGAEPGEDLSDYFKTVKFEGPEIEQDELTPPPVQSVEQSTTQPTTQPATTQPTTLPPPEPRASEKPDEPSPIGVAMETGQMDQELEIDWSTEPYKPQSQRRKVARSKPKSAVASVSATKSEPSAETIGEQSHWDELASSLGLAPAKPGESKTAPEELLSNSMTPPEAESAEAFSTDDPQTPNVLDEMFVSASELIDDDTSVDSSSDESYELAAPADDPDDLNSDVADFGDDDQYVEFEIQDLHSGEESEFASTQPRSPQERDRRPRAERKPKSRSRSTDRETESTPSKPAGSRRSRRDRPKPVKTADGPEDSSPTHEKSAEGDQGDHRISRKQPTWHETVNVIVESNLAARKKNPRRARGRGRGRN